MKKLLILRLILIQNQYRDMKMINQQLTTWPRRQKSCHMTLYGIYMVKKRQQQQQ